MSPFVKKQVLPVVAPLVLLSIAAWVGGLLLVFRTAGLIVAATGAYMMYVAFRPGAFHRGGAFNMMVFLLAFVIAAGLAMAGPFAPALLEHELHHRR